MSAPTVSNELLQAVLTASEDQQRAALKVLRGEAAVSAESPAKERFMTLKEIGQTLGFHSSTLWRWNVPGHDLGGRRRFLLSEVRAYLKTPEFQQRVNELKQQRKINRSLEV